MVSSARVYQTLMGLPLLRENHHGTSVGGVSGSETTIGLGLERKVISYKDVCLGVNGHNISEEDAMFFEEHNMYNEKRGPVNGDKEDLGFLGDPLCQVVRYLMRSVKVLESHGSVLSLLGCRGGG
ncbi:LysR family transcriptional regulator [Sesbania bispinosa]|nr:LysR family transcriptional regulator [Sesbania bispinosa]